MKKQSFTLVELLVVIAIIGVLAATLFPAITTALENARRSACSANASSIAKVLIGYTNSSDAIKFATGMSAGSTPKYNDKKQAYEGMEQAERAAKLMFNDLKMQGKGFMCPSTPAQGANRKIDPLGKSWNHQSFTKGTRENREFDWNKGKDFKQGEDYAIRNGGPASSGKSYMVADGFREELRSNGNYGHNHFECGLVADENASVEKIDNNPKWYEGPFGKYPSADETIAEKLNALNDKDIGILLY